MNEATKRILISQSDLNICSRAVEFRFRDHDAEAGRMELMSDLLSAGSALEQALRIHTHCALVNHSGTYGTMDFAAATERLFNAMFRYAALVREIAARFGSEVPSDQAPARLEIP
jgi:hypothetical protein